MECVEAGDPSVGSLWLGQETGHNVAGKPDLRGCLTLVWSGGRIPQRARPCGRALFWSTFVKHITKSVHCSLGRFEENRCKLS